MASLTLVKKTLVLFYSYQQINDQYIVLFVRINPFIDSKSVLSCLAVELQRLFKDHLSPPRRSGVLVGILLKMWSNTYRFCLHPVCS